MKAKRSLGQNFFINKNLGESIVQYIPRGNTVVEIGPGQGFFTQLLTERFKDVIAIEKDKELADILKQLHTKVQIFEADFLSFDLNLLPSRHVSFFGSLPYNVSKPIIKKIIESDYFTNPAYFIVQKEVAEKYIYKKPYNILSLTTAIYADTKKIFNIGPESFRPRPNVESALLQLTPAKRDIQQKDTLKELIINSFRQPRKNLKNNLRNTPFEEYLGEYSSKRASDLTLEEYLDILKKM